MSDAAKTDREIETIRAENRRSWGRADKGYTGPERLGTSRPGRNLANVAARRQRALQARRRRG